MATGKLDSTDITSLFVSAEHLPTARKPQTREIITGVRELYNRLIIDRGVRGFVFRDFVAIVNGSGIVKKDTGNAMQTAIFVSDKAAQKILDAINSKIEDEWMHAKEYV